MLLKPGEKRYTQRCRLFIGNLPNDITEEAFKKLFAKYGEPSEVFINKGKGFGFIRLVRSLLLAFLESKFTPEWKCIYLRCCCFAGVSSTCRDSKGRVGWYPYERQTTSCAICHALCSPLCEEPVSVCLQWAPRRGLFAVWNGWKSSCHCWWSWAFHGQGYRGVCLQTSCQKGPRSVQWGCFPSYLVSTDVISHTSCLLELRIRYFNLTISLTSHFPFVLHSSSPRPVVVEPLEQFDDEDGLPEKLAQKNPRYQA